MPDNRAELPLDNLQPDEIADYNAALETVNGHMLPADGTPRAYMHAKHTIHALQLLADERKHAKRLRESIESARHQIENSGGLNRDGCNVIGNMLLAALDGRAEQHNVILRTTEQSKDSPPEQRKGDELINALYADASELESLDVTAVSDTVALMRAAADRLAFLERAEQALPSARERWEELKSRPAVVNATEEEVERDITDEPK